jgi:serine phosphatase RsbU (regulator of sigma subunit)
MEELRDLIVVVGAPDEKLLRLFAKLGYRLEKAGETQALVGLVERLVVDLVLIDRGSEPEALAILDHLRKDELTRMIPIVIMGLLPAEARVLKEKGYERLEIVEATAALASVSAKVATQVRLRKMAGADSLIANVSDANAMLRDITGKLRKDLEEAREIQQSLLPLTLPTGEEFEVAAAYQPLKEVGGDWYYVKKHESGKISFQIGDVTGHGLSAAFICSMTKLALTAARVEPPHDLLEQMNLLLSPQLPDERFVTFASALYHPGTGALEFARAGHPPAILFHRATSEVKELKGKGFALGFMPDGKYEAITDSLQVGDVFVLYTDGVTEAQNRSLQLYGTPRLINSIKAIEAESSGTGASAAAILERILLDFRTFIEGRLLNDDVTVVVLKRKK